METAFTIGVFAMGLFCAAILIIGLAVYKSYTPNKGDTSKNLADDLKYIFSQIFPATPGISINGSTIDLHGTIKKNYVIARTSVETEALFKNKRFLSTKKLEMTGAFRIDSGFSAESVFRISANSRTKTASVYMPHIEILQIEPVGKIMDTASNGWWNKLSDKDRNSTMDMLLENAAEQAEGEGVKEKAEKVITENIRNVFSTLGYQVFIRQGDC
jgi:hypothetical protein